MLYVSLSVTTKQKLKVNKMQKKIRKESKHNIKEIHQATKQKRKERELQTNPAPLQEDNEQNHNEYIPIYDYFKCKWTEFSNQKT